MPRRARFVKYFYNSGEAPRSGVQQTAWWVPPAWAVGHYCHIQVKIAGWTTVSPTFSLQGKMPSLTAGAVLTSAAGDGLTSNAQVLPNMRVQQTQAGSVDWTANVAVVF